MYHPINTDAMDPLPQKYMSIDIILVINSTIIN